MSGPGAPQWGVESRQILLPLGEKVAWRSQVG